LVNNTRLNFVFVTYSSFTEEELKSLRDNNKEQASSYTKLESQQVTKYCVTESVCLILHFGMLKNSEICTFFVQNELSKAKDELEAEKRELVRTLERRSQEMEQQSGKLINKHS